MILVRIIILLINDHPLSCECPQSPSRLSTSAWHAISGRYVLTLYHGYIVNFKSNILQQSEHSLLLLLFVVTGDCKDVQRKEHHTPTTP